MILIYSIFALTSLRIEITETIGVENKFELINESQLLETIDIDASFDIKMKSGIELKIDAKEKDEGSLNVQGILNLHGQLFKIDEFDLLGEKKELSYNFREGRNINIIFGINN